MSRSLKAIILSGWALLAAGIAVRMLVKLPSLAGRSKSRAFSNTDDTRIGRAVVPMSEAHPGRSGIYVLDDALEAFAVRVTLARAAEQSIDAQYYIWHGDVTGTLLFDELRSAADRGVRVRLLLDDNPTSGLDETLAALDAHPNIELRLFNPFAIRAPRWIGYLTDFGRLNRRMHNKSFTVDNQATIIGGRNIGDEYFGAGDAGFFVDLDVLAIGSVVPEVSVDFDRYWASGSAYPADRVLPPASKNKRDAISAKADRVKACAAAQRYLEAVRTLPIVTQLAERTLPLEWARVRMLSDDPSKGLGRAAPDGLLISRMEKMLEGPQKRLGLVSGYFVPTAQGVAAFTAMAGRGTEVDVVTNALEATDVPIVHAGYDGYRKPLLQAGVRLWELRRSASAAPAGRRLVGSSGSGLSGSATALHAKTFSIDGERLFVGSFNFDPRSARLNTELGFIIDSPDLVRRIDDRLARNVPMAAYEVRLSEAGKLFWVERRGEEEIFHDIEPGTTFWQRAAISLLSRLPIEWLL